MLKSFIAISLLSIAVSSTLSHAQTDINNKPVTIDVGAIERDIKTMFEEAVAATEADDQEKAIKLFTAITNKYPDVPEPYNNLAVIYVKRGQYESAIQALKTAIKFNPSYATAKENLGDLYMKLASDSYSSAFAAYPSNKVLEKKVNLSQQIFKPTTAVATPEPIKVAAPTTTLNTTIPAVMPAKSTPPVEAQAPTSSDSKTVKNEVTTFIKSWASAWANKDAQAYLRSYDITFQTPGNIDRQEWNNSRIDRISKAKKIVVNISDINVTLNSPTTATITFAQFYSSDNYKDNTRKIVDVVKTNNSWYIVREVSLTN